jgi:hypothetical protein
MSTFRTQLLFLGFLQYHQGAKAVDDTDVGVLCDLLPSFVEKEYTFDDTMKVSIDGFETLISYKSAPNGKSNSVVDLHFLYK